MSAETIILVLLIATALAFDFTNGFHDTGNAMATSIATGALKPRNAVLLAGVLNLVGAFLSVEVAVTVTTSVLKIQDNKTGVLLSVDHSVDGPHDHLRRSRRRHPVEPADVAVRHSVQLVARAVRRSDRCGPGRTGHRGREVDRHHLEGADPRDRRSRDRLRCRRVRDLAGVPDHPQRGGEAARRGLPLGPDRHRFAWSRCRTAPTTRRRRWASSRSR